MTENLLKDIEGIVEATNFETLCLYEKYKDDWKQINSGTFVTVAKVENRPICLSLTVNFVKGNKILFIEPTSQLIDWKLINKWLEDNFKNVKTADAMNFHILINN